MNFRIPRFAGGRLYWRARTPSRTKSIDLFAMVPTACTLTEIHYDDGDN